MIDVGYIYTEMGQNRLRLMPGCIWGPDPRVSDLRFLRSSSSCMIFSAIDMLEGGLVFFLGASLVLLRGLEPSVGVDGLEADLSTLKPILNAGLGADVVVEDAVSGVASLFADELREMPMRTGAASRLRPSSTLALEI